MMIVMAFKLPGVVLDVHICSMRLLSFVLNDAYTRLLFEYLADC